MKIRSCISLVLVSILCARSGLFAQERLVDVKKKTYKTTEKL